MGIVSKTTAGVKGFAEAASSAKFVSSAYWWTRSVGAIVFRYWPRSGRTESFEEAVQRLGLTEERLARRLTQFRVEFYVHGALAIALIGGGSRLVIDDPIVGWCVLAFSALPIVSAAQSSLRAWQIKHRQLGGYDEWVKTPANWLP